jgi:hypothetical protein
MKESFTSTRIDFGLNRIDISDALISKKNCPNKKKKAIYATRKLPILGRHVVLLACEYSWQAKIKCVWK